MSSPDARAPVLPPGEIHRLSVEQYHAMIRAGILTDEDRVELLEGWLVEKVTKRPAHATAKGLVAAALSAILPTGWFVRLEDAITTSDSEPEPDAAVVRGEVRDYVQRHPGPSDVGLVVEIADTSLDRDRGQKRKIYATAGLPHYWIVNLVDRRIEAASEPDGKGAFRRIEAFGETEAVPVVLDGRECGRLAVRELLP